MDKKVISNIRTLAIDMIDNAGSGHPGIVLGASPTLYTLYMKHLNVKPSDYNWINRDRFVLSAGHGSAMLYSNLYLAGYDISLDDIKNFRRINSKTPGHPELGITPGVDISTGPLGQGIANAVGMAIGEKILKSIYKFPKSDKSLIDYNVYVLCGDGDLMEGISYEAISLAGALSLDNLIVLYDSNDISLDGKTNLAFKENVRDRFNAMGWYTDIVKDGEDINSIDKAINKAKSQKRPSLIEVKTIIGKGSLEENTNAVHGKLLSKDDISQLKAKLEIPDIPFHVDDSAKKYYTDSINKRVDDKYNKWLIDYIDYISNVLDGDTKKIENSFNNNISVDLSNLDLSFNVNDATRVTNSYIMNQISKMLTHFIGGSADLASSTKTYLNDFKDITSENFEGKNIWFGVREHAMGAILNGLASVGLRPFGSTFLAFADYIKPAIRLSALMELPVNYIFSHDTINIGQDGPTHQPIEQLAMLRSVPNLKVFRPADVNEIIGCWNIMLNASKNPNALILSRDKCELLATTDANSVKMGAYIVRKEIEKLHAIIIATGSEVQIAYKIANELYEQYKLDIRVVSMPSMELFLSQDETYQTKIIPKGYRTIVIEAGSSFGWHQFVYNYKYLITLDKFGQSGTKEEVLKYMNFDYESIKNRVEKLLK